MWEFIKGFFSALIPPTDASPKAVYRYRSTVSLAILGLTIVVTVHIALACGYLAGSFIGFSGFAKADELKKLSAQVASDKQEELRATNRIQAGQFDSKLQEDQSKWCAATLSHNTLALEVLTQRISWELDQFRYYAGHDYRLPTCAEIIPQWTGPVQH